MFKKANGNDLLGRYREIISDPLNLMIERVPNAGIVENNHVWLHNGIKVPLSGPHSYYAEFSQILTLNRGVHEPLEEFVFQKLLNKLHDKPLMLELGAYWGHYSMWLKKTLPYSIVNMVEPEIQNLEAGKYNFEINGLDGKFINSFVGNGHFAVDKYLNDSKINTLDILHSDIQGYELEMLDDCSISLNENKINYIFISTHSQLLHDNILNKLSLFNYRIEVSSDFEDETTSYDGLVFASSKKVNPIFEDFKHLGRTDICRAKSSKLLEYLIKLN